MKPIANFTLAKHTGEYEHWPLVTELIRSGVPTGKYVPGYVLEAQYEHNGYFLLATSWDCLFEEAQTFLLLSPGLDVIQKHSIGAAYVSIWLEGHDPIAENSVMFHCDGDLDVEVTVDLRSEPRMITRQFDRVTGKRWPPLIKRLRVPDILKFLAALGLMWLSFEGVIWMLR